MPNGEVRAEGGRSVVGRSDKRLTRRAEFRKVMSRGKSRADRAAVLIWLAADGESRRRVGISVGRRVGKAHERNRVKRLIREAFGALDRSLERGGDVVVIARPGIRTMALGEIEDRLRRLLQQVGALEGEGGPGGSAG